MTAIAPTSAASVIQQAQARSPAVFPAPAVSDSVPGPAKPAVERPAAEPSQATGFQDGATGRYVTRVSDRWSGQTMFQIPTAELLRFLATDPAAVVPSSVDDG